MFKDEWCVLVCIVKVLLFVEDEEMKIEFVVEL